MNYVITTQSGKPKQNGHIVNMPLFGLKTDEFLFIELSSQDNYVGVWREIDDREYGLIMSLPVPNNMKPEYFKNSVVTDLIRIGLIDG